MSAATGAARTAPTGDINVGKGPNTTTGPASPQRRQLITPLFLFFYDFWVLGIVNTFVWGCSTTRYLLPQFRANVRKNHLDVGVGTGYYLEKSQIPNTTRLTLVDIEWASLQAAKNRSRRSDVNLIVADILHPLCLNEKFDSVSMYYLLHCIHAPMREKCRIFSHIKYNMTPDGVIHGANILGRGVVEDNWLGKRIRRRCLRRGVFDNREDNAYEFEEALRKNFKKVETRIVGPVFIWMAEGPKFDD